MAKSHCTCYLAVTAKKIEIVNSYDEAKKLTHKKKGGKIKGFSTHQEAKDAISKYKKEVTRQSKKLKQKRNNYEFSSPWVQDCSHYLVEAKSITLICKLGTGGHGSTIKSLGFDTHIIETSKGATPALMNLELGYAALKLADYHINQGADTVETHGLHASVGKTLNDYAPDWRANGWLNSAGKSPANLELVQSMFELYEQIKGKVTLGAK